MENLLIKISEINDFVFCPISIYFHHLIMDLNSMIYYGNKQIEGKIVHKTIDEKIYSTSKDVITSLDVYSQNYNLIGKIDIYDISSKELIERKKKVNKIYDGYVFQLYAQYFCMIEMGYEIKKMKIYSYDDNETYIIPLPEEDLEMFNKFSNTINEMKTFDVINFYQKNAEKCANCIYNNMCDRGDYD